MKHVTLTSGGNQTLQYINERNLYRLIMRSRLDSAERFQDWVEGEILPTIRKTGSYVPAELTEIEVAKRYLLASNPSSANGTIKAPSSASSSPST